jgi:hypothetical protein
MPGLRRKLLSWDYAQCPDVHISFYEPDTLARCMTLTGFHPKESRSLASWSDIIKYKVLKTLRIRNRSYFIDVLPWGVITRLVDARYGVSRQPYGVAIEDSQNKPGGNAPPSAASRRVHTRSSTVAPWRSDLSRDRLLLRPQPMRVFWLQCTALAARGLLKADHLRGCSGLREEPNIRPFLAEPSRC